MKVFVYGTLRVGQGNYNWAKACITEHLGVHQAQGLLYGDPRMYPFADFEGDGTITGDLFEVDETSRTFHRMHEMEVGAGYTPVEITVHNAYGVPVEEVMAYHHSRASQYAPLIEGGDWLEAQGDRHAWR